MICYRGHWSEIGVFVSPSDYLRAILEREAVSSAEEADLRLLEQRISAICAPWAGRHLLEIFPAGAIEKGTANQSGTSIDFLVALSPRTPYLAHLVFHSLHRVLEREGFDPQPHDVCLTIDIDGHRTDVIPARRDAQDPDTYELFSARRDTTFRTNLLRNIRGVRNSGRTEEIRVIKLWRDQHGLDFPSLYLELCVIAALRRNASEDLAENVWATLGYLERYVVPRAVLDPTNAINIISEELTREQKAAIRDAAAVSRAGRSWSEIIT